MRCIDRMENMRPCCAAVGSFDSIHRGHRAVIEALVEASRKSGLRPVVVSFACDTAEGALTTEREKAYLFEKLGVDTMVSLSAENIPNEEAVWELAQREMGIAMAVVGSRYPARSCLKAYGIPIRTVDTVCDGGQPITASRVADYLEAGDMESVAGMCGHPYIMLGKVVHGKALGRTVGMPTANMKVHSTKRRPPNGVYATRTHIGNRSFVGVTNVGTRPSVDERPEITIETMLADFEGDIYGESTVTEFACHIREIRRFGGIDEVHRQVQKDMVQALELFQGKHIVDI